MYIYYISNIHTHINTIYCLVYVYTYINICITKLFLMCNVFLNKSDRFCLTASGLMLKRRRRNSRNNSEMVYLSFIFNYSIDIKND